MEIRKRLLIVLLSCAVGSTVNAEEISFIPWQLQTDIPSSTPCEVHVQQEPAGADEIFPCGQPIELDDSESIVWLEQSGWITPFGSRVKDLMARDGSTVELPLRPGAYVELDSDLRLSPKERVEVRHYNSSVHGRIQLTPIIRSIEPEEQGPVLLPLRSHTLIALRYNGDDLVGVTEKFVATSATTNPIPPFHPSGEGLLFAQIRWPEPSWRDWWTTLDLILGQEETRRTPDVRFQADDHAIAVWYNVLAGAGELALESDEWYVADQVVTIRDGLVTSIDLELVDRVDLDVSVTLADDVEPENEPKDLHLVIRHVRSEDVIAEADVSLDDTTTIEGLPPLPVDLVLEIDGTDAFQRADLSTGGPQAAHFELDPIRVHGTVSHGDEPKKALLSFSNSEVETDEYGDYEAILWQPRLYILKAVIPGVNDDRPIQRPIRISEDRELDIRVPNNSFSVRVTDASTGLPIKGAEAGAMNSYTDPFASDKEPRPMRTSTPAGPTNDTGIAQLPPLSPGTVTIYVSAEGYARGVIEDIPVTESDGERLIDVALQPESVAGTLTLRLSDGSPASSAAVWVLPGPDSLPVWRGSTDEAGKLVLPPAAENAALMVTHPGAGVTVRQWDTAIDPEPDWSLPLAAPPLTVRLQHSDGTPAPQAKIVIWIDGHRFSRMLPHGMASGADFQGVWTARNLPTQPLRIMAFDLGTTIDWTSPSTDALSQVIPFPWPAQPVVTVID